MNQSKNVVRKVMAIALTFALGTLVACETRHSVQEHMVEISGFQFSPETIEVNPGDTITWVNRDIVPHTATGNDGSWDTGLLNPNESIRLTVSQNMTSRYLCRFHVNMTGTVAQPSRSD